MNKSPDTLLAGNTAILRAHTLMTPALVPSISTELLAAADGELWNLRVTSVPAPGEMAAYLAAVGASTAASTAQAAVVGNSTMRDIFFRQDVYPIGQTPYRSMTEIEMAEGKRATTSLTQTAAAEAAALRVAHFHLPFPLLILARDLVGVVLAGARVRVSATARHGADRQDVHATAVGRDAVRHPFQGAGAAGAGRGHLRRG